MCAYLLVSDRQKLACVENCNGLTIMFLVNDTSSSREARIKQFLFEDPAIAALLSVIYFEWTVRRAIIALGTSPNVDIRRNLEKCHGCPAYKDLWKTEVLPTTGKRLPEVVRDWDGLIKAFKLRHQLVHGVKPCSSEYATERVQWAIDAALDIRELCSSHNVDLHSRLPVHRRFRVTQKTN